MPVRSLSLLLLAAQSRILVGGQAVIEGVMMRVPGSYAVAVRNPKGEIQTRYHDFTSLVERSRWMKPPIVRGVVHLFEALKLGIATLNWSAEVAYPEETAGKGSASSVVTTIFAFGLALLLFFIAPLWITTRLIQLEQQALGFNLVSGAIRIAFFLLYLGLISLVKDVKRLFQYHGAEHKTVYAFETGQPLTIESTHDFPTQHPRCGTSFIFIVLIAAILAFALIDTVVMAFAGRISLGLRLMVHLPLIPVVAGIGYEALKITAKYQHLALFRWMSLPGIWLQYITTKRPDDDQVSVALESLKVAFGDQLSEVEGQQYVADAIA
ncbi:MAG: DUF1385 domain-containing protein [Fidelibacterota bacterium]|nr:MAG: DUF1385 domain-containing protein [Candidatus Neomarinimicrobiota bacterium]